MDKFELERRETALGVLAVWYDAGLRFFRKYQYTDAAYRFNLACKTRGLIAHDRFLDGRVAV